MKDRIDRLAELKSGQKITRLDMPKLTHEQLCKYYYVELEEGNTKQRDELYLKYIKEIFK